MSLETYLLNPLLPSIPSVNLTLHVHMEHTHLCQHIVPLPRTNVMHGPSVVMLCQQILEEPTSCSPIAATLVCTKSHQHILCFNHGQLSSTLSNSNNAQGHTSLPNAFRQIMSATAPLLTSSLLLGNDSNCMLFMLCMKILDTGTFLAYSLYTLAPPH